MRNNVESCAGSAQDFVSCSEHSLADNVAHFGIPFIQTNIFASAATSTGNRYISWRKLPCQ